MLYHCERDAAKRVSLKAENVTRADVETWDTLIRDHDKKQDEIRNQQSKEVRSQLYAGFKFVNSDKSGQAGKSRDSPEYVAMRVPEKTPRDQAQGKLQCELISAQ